MSNAEAQIQFEEHKMRACPGCFSSPKPEIDAMWQILYKVGGLTHEANTWLSQTWYFSSYFSTL